MQHEHSARLLERKGQTQEADAAHEEAMRHLQEKALASSAMERLESQMASQQAAGKEVAMQLSRVARCMELCQAEQAHRTAKGCLEEAYQKLLQEQRENKLSQCQAQQEATRLELDVDKLTAEANTVAAQVCQS
jgi:hypothetical protein